MTAGFPNFFVVGAAKSGTTSLYHYLSQHPEVYMPRDKEPHWFSKVEADPGSGFRPVASEEEYLRLFAVRGDFSAVGEASPSYLWDEGAAARIREAAPGARIIAILRDPVERAHSHYLMDVRAGRQDLPFAEAVKRAHRAGRKTWNSTDLYVELGFYAGQLRRYREVFDAGRILVLLYDDLMKNPKALLRSTLEFLGVDPRYADSIRTDVRYNTYMVPKNKLAEGVFRSRVFRSGPSRALKARLVPNRHLRARLRETLLFKQDAKPEIDAGAREFLAQLYRPDVRDLERLLDRDLGHWLTESAGRG